MNMGNCSAKEKQRGHQRLDNGRSYVEPPIPTVDPVNAGGNVAQDIITAPRMKNVFAAPIEITSNFVAPIFQKKTAEYNFLEGVLGDNFIFTNLTKKEKKSLLNAFEKYDVKSGETIITQGEVVGDYFYVIQSGSVDFIVNGENVGTAGKGKTFGDQALLYNCPRAATVVAKEDCGLWRVDQKTFRQILASNTISTDKDIKSILKQISFLENVADEYLNIMAYAASPETFASGQTIFKKGDKGDKFYVIQEGVVTVKDIEVGGKKFDDQELSAGDYFGERAIVKDEPRAATIITKEECVVLALSREVFLQVCGNLEDLVIKSSDVRKLKAMLAFSRSDVKPSEMSDITSLIKDVTIEAGTTVFSAGTSIKGAVYIVRSGSILVTHSETGEKKTITAGGVFGEHSIHTETYVPERTAVVEETCVCGKLTEAGIYSVLHDRKRLYNPWKKKISEIQDTSALDGDIKLDDLEKHRILGVGTFGKVWLVSSVDANKKKTAYALKIQRKRQLLDHQQVDGVFREIQIMADLDHPFILKLVNVYQDEKSIMMLVKLVQGGELFGIMKRAKNKKLSENDSRFYAAGILEGLSFMHHRKILYRDLKPENVLIDADGYPVIVDLGFAKIVPDKTFTLCGTPWYIAPEVIVGKGHDKGCDYWSWAIMLHEMITGVTPFHEKGTDQMTLFKAIVHGQYKLRYTSREAADLLKRILVPRPSYRLGNLAGGSMDLKNHLFFKDVDFDDVFEKNISSPWKPQIKDALDVSDFDNWDHMDTKERDRKLTTFEQKKFQKFDNILHHE